MDGSGWMEPIQHVDDDGDDDEDEVIHDYDHGAYLIIVIFFTLTKFLEDKIYTQKARKLRQNTQKIAKFLRYYGKIHSKLPIFRVKSVKIYTGQKKFTRTCSWGS